MSMALVWQTDSADIVTQNADILLDDSLCTAVIISLFTDRRALASDELPAGKSSDKRGWWGDSFSTRPIGSRLWLLSREKQLSSVLKRAEEYANEALQWLIDDKHIQQAVVNATVPREGWLLLSIVLTLPDGSVVPLSFNATLKGI